MRDVIIIIISLPRTISAPSSSEVGELNSLLALVVIFPAAGLGWRAQAWLTFTPAMEAERTQLLLLIQSGTTKIVAWLNWILWP